MLGDSNEGAVEEFVVRTAPTHRSAYVFAIGV